MMSEFTYPVLLTVLFFVSLAVLSTYLNNHYR